jgi:tyrosinase
MSRVPTSANGPIFWAHHANVDRIWNRWLDLGEGRQNPSDPVFLNRVYTFVGLDGTNVTITAANALSSTALGYRYDDDTIGDRRLRAVQVLASSRGVGPRAEGRTKLDVEPVTVTLRSAAGADAVRSAIREAAPGGERPLIVRVSEVRFRSIPASVYGVYLQLPEGATDRATLKLHYVGSLSFFAREPDHGHRAAEVAGPITFSQSFDVTNTVARLRAAGVTLPENIKVTLRPITVKSAPGRRAAVRAMTAEAAREADVSFSSVELVR